MMKEMTVTISEEHCGLVGYKGMSFTCINMNFTECGGNGVWACKTSGKLIDCEITKCGCSGIKCLVNGFIEVFGEKTKVNGNCTTGGSDGNTHYGLNADSSSSTIVLHSPLTKESISTNNGEGGNWGGEGKIENK